MEQYIYLTDDKVPMYSSPEPMEFEDQTLAIKVTTESKEDMEMLLDLVFSTSSPCELCQFN
jgi:hypothetical protein